ncbi:TPM domain-containing protein [Flavicella sediminum]|uniref:TPM domain-containing protein n=1 Tax=Flavicella sediminum TaxID=2585141 RepID=UPI0011224D16|nr:TPM domain-containing protein [Flavicella sediminum]
MPEYHLSEKEEKAVVDAIKAAEKNTSGEIRVHIDPKSDKTAMERAQELFFELGMQNTAAKNGVLFFLDIKNHGFAIIGDSGIDKVVPADFWNTTKELVLTEFKKGKFGKGLQLGIEEAGKKLKQFFPYQSDDVNELSDELSKG